MVNVNKWEFFITIFPTDCTGVPDGNSVWDVTRYLDFKVNNGTLTRWGEEASFCPDPIAHARDGMITYFRAGPDPFWGLTLTDADTIYINGVLFHSPAPTHCVTMSLGFVPPELTAYFQTSISDISNMILNYIAPPPAPWQYLYTTYDAVANEFNLWFYTPTPEVMAVGDRGFMQHAGVRGEKQVRYGFMSISDDVTGLINWITAWIPLVLGIILIIMAAAFGYPFLITLALLFSGLAILSWKVIDATNKQILSDTISTNLGIQLEQNNKEDAARTLTENTWNASAKTQTDCVTRLQDHRDIHLAKLNGFMDQYAKYPGLVTELTSEKSSFTLNANGIIDGLKSGLYTTGTCDTYFVNLNSEISTSNVTINDSLGRYIKVDETYSVACKGWTNQAACEKGGCYWYSGGCHQDEQCWISDPLGGCVLSASTGKTIVGVTVGLALLGAAYWLLTRKRAEVSSIYIGAREAVTTEAARAKAAYSSIRAPSVPAAARVIARAPVIPY